MIDFFGCAHMGCVLRTGSREGGCFCDVGALRDAVVVLIAEVKRLEAALTSEAAPGAVERPPRITHIYCPQCGTTQPLAAGDDPRLDSPGPDSDPAALWGDLCCGVCHLVVATVEYERAPAARAEAMEEEHDNEG